MHFAIASQFVTWRHHAYAQCDNMPDICINFNLISAVVLFFSPFSSLSLSLAAKLNQKPTIFFIFPAQFASDKKARDIGRERERGGKRGRGKGSGNNRREILMIICGRMQRYRLRHWICKLTQFIAAHRPI